MGNRAADHKTAAGAPAAPAPPGEAAGTRRPHQAAAATGNGHRKRYRVGRRNGRERREASWFLRSPRRRRTGSRAGPDASQHAAGAATARAQAGDGLTGACKSKRVPEAARRSPGRSAHAGVGVPVTAAEDGLQLCRRGGWSVHTYALPAPRRWPDEQDGCTPPRRNGSRVHTAQVVAFRACCLTNLTATAGLISSDLQKYLKGTGSAET